MSPDIAQIRGAAADRRREVETAVINALDSWWTSIEPERLTNRASLARMIAEAVLKTEPPPQRCAHTWSEVRFGDGSRAVVCVDCSELLTRLHWTTNATVSQTEWDKLVKDERAHQVAKGYDHVHDRAHGPYHLIEVAMDRARRGETAQVGAVLHSLSNVIDEREHAARKAAGDALRAVGEALGHDR